MRSVLTAALSVLLHTGFAQATLVINGAVISLQNNASLVVDNPDNLALGQTGNGYIASDGGGNLVIWSIGAGNGGLFVLPFGTAAAYLPMTFRAAGGTPEGKMVFGTYAIPPADTAADLPPDVTNLNLAGVDQSGKFANRFWQIAPQGYTNKPTLTDLTVTFSDADYAPPKNISEASLMARRWNNVLDAWDDFLPVSTLNAAANTLTIAGIPGNELFDWWAMADDGLPLPVTLINFEARVQGQAVILQWQTVLESNADHFEIWRSPDGQRFDSAGAVAAAGNSNVPLDYSFTDAKPYPDLSYYRLKSVDRDGAFVWTAIKSVLFGTEGQYTVYPNPAKDVLHIRSKDATTNEKPIARIIAVNGHIVMAFTLSSADAAIPIGALAPGTYQVQILGQNKRHILSFIKK